MNNYNILNEIYYFLKNSSFLEDTPYRIKFNIRRILQRSENEMYFIKNDGYFENILYNDWFIRITMII